MLTIEINSNDRSSWIEWTSFSWQPALTKEPDILSFAIKQQPGRTMPELGEAVVFSIDGTAVFSGTITERRQVNLGGLLMGFTYTCKDGQFDLDKLLVAKAYEDMTARAILLDIISNFTDGTFTTTNVAATTPTITSIKFNYEPVSKCIQRLADLAGFDWYVDADKDLHFFEASLISAPFNLDDTSGNHNFESLTFNRNILELKNSIVIAGGEFKTPLDASETPDIYEANGTDRVFFNIYRYANIQVTVDAVSQDVGIDGIDNEADHDVLYNFQEKAIKFPDASKPTSGQEVKIFGDAYVQLLTQVLDSDSIDTYGERQTLYKNEKILSINEAFSAGKAELLRWSAGSYEGQFTTREDGLRPGQMITINSTKYNVNKQFKINRVTATARTPDSLLYSVNFIASGQVSFTDMMVGLIGNSQDFNLTDNTVIQRLRILKERLEAADQVTLVSTSPPYKWGPGSDNDFDWNFGTWS